MFFVSNLSVCVCVCACVRVRACMRVCVRACVCDILVVQHLLTAFCFGSLLLPKHHRFCHILTLCCLCIPAFA